MNFEQLISSLQPVGDAIDGTPRQRKRGKRGPGAPAVGRRWRCNLCHHEETDQDAMLAHLQAELVQVAALQSEDGMISQKLLADVSAGIMAVVGCITNGEISAAPGIPRLFRGAALGLALAAACDPKTGSIDIDSFKTSSFKTSRSPA